MEDMFWADQIAKKIVERNPDKKEYFMQGGIAPSARKHIGSIREIITCYLVKLALEKMGKKVRFAYSWDAYDRLKKISASIPEEKRKQCIELEYDVMMDLAWDIFKKLYKNFFNPKFLPDLEEMMQ